MRWCWYSTNRAIHKAQVNCNGTSFVVPIMIATKGIEPGQELLTDYGEAFWETYRQALNQMRSELFGF
jgi:hypothetical protein